MMRALNGFLFLVCACGLKIKVDREDSRREFRCPRCSRMVCLPQAGLAALGGVLGGIPEAAPKPGMTDDRLLVYHRKTTGWETFSCTCGHTLQLSPAFSGSHLECRACSRKVLIENPRSPAAV